MRLRYIIWSSFLLTIAIGLSCIEDPTSANKRVQKDSSFMITRAIDSFKRIYEGNSVISINPAHYPPDSKFINNNDSNFFHRQKSSDTSGFKYKKLNSINIKDSKIKEANKNFENENNKGKKLDQTLKNGRQKLKLKFLAIINFSNSKFNNIKIIWIGYPFGKGFYF